MLHLVRLAYFVTMVLVLAFVWYTTQALPETVAAGVDLSGHPHDAMSRDLYLSLQFAIQLGLPWVVVALPTWSARRGGPGLNIPNMAYWLAPQRRAETASRLATLMYAFALLLSLFLAWVHWGIVQVQTAPDGAAAWETHFGSAMAFVAVGGLIWGWAFKRSFHVL